MKKIKTKLVLKKKTIAQLNEMAVSNKKLHQVQGGKGTHYDFCDTTSNPTDPIGIIYV